MTTDNEQENRGYGEEGQSQEEQDRAAEGGDTRRHSEEPSVPPSTEEQEKLIDVASEDSFPASDPPSYWQRPAPDRSEEKRRRDSRS